MTWFVYIVQCNNGPLYTGIAIDVKKRVAQHNAGVGAKSIRALGRPVKLVYQEQMSDKSSALKREYQIKHLSRKEKMKLLGL